jgi:signal transduction histidine kinase
VVEDSEPDRRLIQEYLSESTVPVFHLDFASSLAEALKLVSPTEHDAVLLDLSLPDSAAADTFERFASVVTDIPVIVLTGLDDLNLGLVSVRQGAQDYLMKGKISQSLLSRVIQYSIERKKVETERAAALMAALESKVAAEQALWARDEFISIASHELKTPLTSLILQTDLLVKGFQEGTLNEYLVERFQRLLKTYERELSRLKKLIDNLLDVSRINAGRLGIQTKPGDLSALVRDTVSRFSDELSSAGCQVILKIEPDVRGDFDELRMEQVLVNILSNATKYAKGKPVEIRTGKSRDRIWFSVQDHGLGLTEEERAKIFDRFERLSPPKGTSGLGLGLYITRQIVNAHQGKIEVKSAPGQGALFTVEIPKDSVSTSAA